MEFKFDEERNVAVFTTKQVLDGAPILYVYHDDDGYWQFHAVADPDLDDAKLVALETIVTLDPSINELHDLPLGENAWRNDAESNWQYSTDAE